MNVEFSGTRMSYQTKLKQTFDATLTNSECGTTCTETDNVNISFFFIILLFCFVIAQLILCEMLSVFHTVVLLSHLLQREAILASGFPSVSNSVRPFVRS